jgi:hypothetical protein
MAAYGIIGFPLTHSFSKQYFTEKIEREGITDAAFYEFPLIQISDFPFLLKNNPSLKGLAVPIPYKEQVLKYIAHLSEEVKEIGAANCIRIRDNELTAFNTDITGFEKSRPLSWAAAAWGWTMGSCFPTGIRPQPGRGRTSRARQCQAGSTRSRRSLWIPLAS